MRPSTTCLCILLTFACIGCGPDLKKLRKELSGGVKDTVSDLAEALRAQLKGFRENGSTAKPKVMQILLKIGKHLAGAQSSPQDQKRGQLLGAVTSLRYLRSKLSSQEPSPDNTGLTRLYSSWEQALGGPDGDQAVDRVLSQLTELRQQWLQVD